MTGFLDVRDNVDTFALYQYKPSLIAALVFVVLFLATTSMHCYQAFRNKTVYFIPLIVGGFFEWIGYAIRILARSHMDSLGIFIGQTLLLLLPPSLFAASIYMVLGRLIVFTDGERMAPIRASRLTKIFVVGDVFAFIVQSGGGSLMAKASSQHLGKVLVTIGLLLQIAFFGLFVVTSAIFHIRIHRSPTSVSTTVPWEKYIYALYGASLLILIRSVFRIFEFNGGHDGVLMKSEVYLYIFDATLMCGVMVVFNLVHPGKIIGRRGNKGSMPLGTMDTESYGGSR